MAGIYIHIPFCKQACFYCDFHFSTNMALKDEMVNAICHEIKLQKDYLKKERIHSVYFGGGTPSLLNELQLQKILNTLNQYLEVSSSAEITLEANPDDITPEQLKMLFQNGINRLSVGVQSFNAEILKWMNRAHNAKHAFRCLEWINESEFKNFSVDLIYGIPISTHVQWRDDLKTLLSFLPPHISSYCLTIEPATVFGNWQKKGKLSEASEEYAAEQFIELVEALQSSGYEHYEISNFAQSSFVSQHNSSYWQQKPYLGLGPSAHSYNGQSRQFNLTNNTKYIKAIQQDILPFEKEQLSRNDQINEYLMTSLRTSDGCNLSFLSEKYGYELMNEQNKIISQWLNNDLCILENHRICLTRKGKLLADKLASDLFLVN
ncbi:radical SAM family heme chaperone HemW [Marivirga sp. S37H4]|uniref:Heme chaperone HemW n=1 Tax=Marivirga aurantiaca TaxID=2802615 RepID=A0A935C9W9_9BACT|nr:radical SAM family heme chaperone HemW [Marivirga aurantiaca]MBK6265857.1 radical SAM family heme chaperone HemW [Marivirga aurantiaca]